MQSEIYQVEIEYRKKKKIYVVASSVREAESKVLEDTNKFVDLSELEVCVDAIPLNKVNDYE